MPDQSLLEYLIYMQQLGFSGLYLDENPFEREPVEAPVKADKPPTRQKSTPSRDARSGTPRTVQESLGSVLQLVSDKRESAGTREKAESIGGDTKAEAFANLCETFADCQACALSTTRNKIVFGQGALDAALVFVGEGPGREEDEQGLAFVGAAGKLLTRIIKAMGFERDEVFIGNIVKCRPPKNRAPLPDEMAICGPILERQIDIIEPRVIVALGATAFRYLKGQAAGIMKHRGTFFQWRSYTVMPTYHPAYLLRNPAAKRDVWQDMQAVMAKLKEPES